jgi:hypothetical protein
MFLPFGSLEDMEWNIFTSVYIYNWYIYIYITNIYIYLTGKVLDGNIQTIK